ncbi:MAG: endonuclease [Niastella sp. SCN 39-18]|nr:endonuclease/exonuclease/phosphatase family protein [Sphingobacteriales bacterium]ODT51669.1 MAG: endonuclease [Niastella sp. SCN 39-18]OJW09697.1 MAG: endonuclease [Sphingobacteriales bacterium 39-19]
MKYIYTILLVACCYSLSAQKASFKVSIIGFYNLENLYDTINDPFKNDEEFLPNSERNYNSRVYFDKLDRLSDVISQIGTDINPDGVALLGVAEIENDTVLTDLVHRPKLKYRNLKFVHYNSPDARGVDVGLIYNPKYFKPIFSAPLFVQLPGGSKDAYYTRDVLYVKGILDGDTIHVFVNHWPSRSGGEERSAPARAAAAAVAKARIDSLMAINPLTKVVLMGDLNDDPVSPSLTKVIAAKDKIKKVEPGEMYNPWVEMYKKGIGTLAYQDAWGLFDQILVSYGWLNKEQTGYFYQKASIFNRDFLVQKTGKYRGYSKRTWDGITYNYGYSDHFPTYIMFLKKVE